MGFLRTSCTLCMSFFKQVRTLLHREGKKLYSRLPRFLKKDLVLSNYFNVRNQRCFSWLYHCLLMIFWGWGHIFWRHTINSYTRKANSKRKGCNIRKQLSKQKESIRRKECFLFVCILAEMRANWVDADYRNRCTLLTIKSQYFNFILTSSCLWRGGLRMRIISYKGRNSIK